MFHVYIRLSILTATGCMSLPIVSEPLLTTANFPSASFLHMSTCVGEMDCVAPELTKPYSSSSSTLFLLRLSFFARMLLSFKFCKKATSDTWH